MRFSIIEKWLDITSYEGLYKVSNFGRVKSFYKKPPLVLKLRRMPNGYVRVGLYKNKQRKYFYIHRLVVTTFLRKPLPKEEVNHKDGIKYHNELNNLEWVTSKDNKLHCSSILYKHNRGENNGSSKLTLIQVKRIRKLLRMNTFTQTAIGNMFGVRNTTICLIKNEKLWKFR